MAEQYAVITAVTSGQNSTRMSIPKESYIIEYENDKTYVTPINTPYWFRIKTTPERCGTFKITVTEDQYANTSSEMVRILPSFSIVVYRKSGWKMQFVEEIELGKENYALLDLCYNSTYYIRHKCFGDIDVYNNSITCHYDTTTMGSVAVWSRLTDIEFYYYYSMSANKPSVLTYRQVIYLDKEQVPLFISTLNSVFAGITNKRNEKPIITLRDVVLTVAGSLVTEAVSGNFLVGIIISIFVTATANLFGDNVIYGNGTVIAQINDFKTAHVKEQRRDAEGNVYEISDMGMKISIKSKTICYDNMLLPVVVDGSLVEEWHKETEVSSVCGPEYYRGKFLRDDEILGKHLGFTKQTLSDTLLELLKNEFGLTEDMKME